MRPVMVASGLFDLIQANGSKAIGLHRVYYKRPRLTCFTYQVGEKLGDPGMRRLTQAGDDLFSVDGGGLSDAADLLVGRIGEHAAVGAGRLISCSPSIPEA
jgi:hypothetical protein